MGLTHLYRQPLAKKPQLPLVVREDEYCFPSCSYVKKVTSVIAKGSPDPELHPPAGLIARIFVPLPRLYYDAVGRVLM